MIATGAQSGGPPIADMARARAEVGNVVAVHRREVETARRRDKDAPGAGAGTSAKTGGWHGRRRLSRRRSPKTSVQTKTYEKTHVSFNLAVLIGGSPRDLHAVTLFSSSYWAGGFAPDRPAKSKFVTIEAPARHL
jgi:hypothetical protein